MTEMESICKTPIRRMVSSTSSFVACSGGEIKPCAPSNIVRAASRENSTLPTSETGYRNPVVIRRLTTLDECQPSGWCGIIAHFRLLSRKQAAAHEKLVGLTRSLAAFGDGSDDQVCAE